MPITLFALLALLSFLAPVLLKLLRWLVQCRSTEVIRVAAPPPKNLLRRWRTISAPNRAQVSITGRCGYLYQEVTR